MMAGIGRRERQMHLPRHSPEGWFAPQANDLESPVSDGARNEEV